MLRTSRPKHHHVMMKRSTDAMAQATFTLQQNQKNKDNHVVLMLQRNPEH